ncbi:hypothetical protein B4U79_11315 [Dinothrombium tinctorium]|uniref:Uncharacterized protein n=1 Tax=Dinothrombium tinctorium TaxID=1965070 RepID=A0A3S3P7G7_9ACAR|nr:hypothetical protein B4U79_11315 [Dinothrombium tinctorium]
MESSGTTGPAKGAIFSHRTFVKILTRNIFFQNRSLITCAYTPIAHGSGLVTFLVSLVEGSIVVSLKRTNVEQLICAIEKYKITSIFLAPYYLTCLTKLDYVPDLSSLQSVVTGASKLSSNIAKTFIKKFSIPEFRQTYGCTEVGFIVTSSHNLCEKFNNTIGKIRPYMKAKIIDPETGKLLGPYQKGEIVATGPSPFDGYHDQPEWTEAIFKDGWVYTGDIGYYDEEENFYIVDRIKDIIKQNSFGFSPSDVEEVLIQHEAVEEAVVVGIPDKEAGEVAHAFIVLKPEISAEAEDLKNFANGK